MTTPKSPVNFPDQTKSSLESLATALARVEEAMELARKHGASGLTVALLHNARERLKKESRGEA